MKSSVAFAINTGVFQRLGCAFARFGGCFSIVVLHGFSFARASHSTPLNVLAGSL